MTPAELIVDTINYYEEDPSRRASDPVTGDCRYLMEDGRMCAVGRYMLRGECQNMEGSYDWLCSLHGKEWCRDEVRDIPDRVWAELQAYHDDWLSPTNREPEIRAMWNRHCPGQTATVTFNGGTLTLGTPETAHEPA